MATSAPEMPRKCLIISSSYLIWLVKFPAAEPVLKLIVLSDSTGMCMHHIGTDISLLEGVILIISWGGGVSRGFPCQSPTHMLVYCKVSTCLLL